MHLFMPLDKKLNYKKSKQPLAMMLRQKIYWGWIRQQSWKFLSINFFPLHASVEGNHERDEATSFGVVQWWNQQRTVLDRSIDVVQFLASDQLWTGKKVVENRGNSLPWHLSSHEKIFPFIFFYNPLLSH